MGRRSRERREAANEACKETGGHTVIELSEALTAGLQWAGRVRWELVRHGLSGLAVCGLGGWVWAERRGARGLAAGWMREQRMREELEAYARLDGIVGPGGSMKNLAKRVCRTIVEKSAFKRAALMVLDAEGRLYVAGSAGMDDLAVAALGEWGVHAIRRERGLGETGPAEALQREKVGSASFVLPLYGHGQRPGRGCERVFVTMMRGQHGTVFGALAVCASEVMPESGMTTVDALAPLESLAVKLARGMENTALLERLMRAEKLAGLGQLAAGVAHELNNPLTAVLGFAELIGETAGEERTRQDAGTITHEAQRMKRTVESLMQFWRPVTLLDEPVKMADLLRELAADCLAVLESRGVKLVVQGAEDAPPVQGSRERLRQVLEHLLNNAAQAIASSQEGRRATDGCRSGLPRGSDELDRSPEIRVTVRHDDAMVRMIVSDTGPGFPDAVRAFDPFYTTRQTGASKGMGLSVCYGIVREHGGEISAFNLHPHGAAVVVELPVRRAVTEDGEERVMVRSGHAVVPSRARRRQDRQVRTEA